MSAPKLGHARGARMLPAFGYARFRFRVKTGVPTTAIDGVPGLVVRVWSPAPHPTSPVFATTWEQSESGDGWVNAFVPRDAPATHSLVVSVFTARRNTDGVPGQVALGQVDLPLAALRRCAAHDHEESLKIMATRVMKTVEVGAFVVEHALLYQGFPDSGEGPSVEATRRAHYKAAREAHDRLRRRPEHSLRPVNDAVRETARRQVVTPLGDFPVWALCTGRVDEWTRTPLDYWRTAVRMAVVRCGLPGTDVFAANPGAYPGVLAAAVSHFSACVPYFYDKSPSGKRAGSYSPCELFGHLRVPTQWASGGDCEDGALEHVLAHNELRTMELPEGAPAEVRALVRIARQYVSFVVDATVDPNTRIGGAEANGRKATGAEVASCAYKCTADQSALHQTCLLVPRATVREWLDCANDEAYHGADAPFPHSPLAEMPAVPAATGRLPVMYADGTFLSSGCPGADALDVTAEPVHDAVDVLTGALIEQADRAEKKNDADAPAVRRTATLMSRLRVPYTTGMTLQRFYRLFICAYSPEMVEHFGITGFDFVDVSRPENAEGATTFGVAAEKVLRGETGVGFIRFAHHDSASVAADIELHNTLAGLSAPIPPLAFSTSVAPLPAGRAGEREVAAVLSYPAAQRAGAVECVEHALAEGGILARVLCRDAAVVDGLHMAVLALQKRH